LENLPYIHLKTDLSVECRFSPSFCVAKDVLKSGAHATLHQIPYLDNPPMHRQKCSPLEQVIK